MALQPILQFQKLSNVRRKKSGFFDTPDQAVRLLAAQINAKDGVLGTLTEKGYWTFLRNSFPNSAEADFAAKYLDTNIAEV